MVEKLPISLCMFVKNEENNLRDCLESVYPIVSEIVVVDTGSFDKTIDIAKKYTDRIYNVGFTDFGSVRTLTAHLALYSWTLMLDADERFDYREWELFRELVDQPPGVMGDENELDEEGKVIIDSWALPRMRWADKWKKKQIEKEAYPDWQVRLFRNHHNRPRISFKRRVHETISGCVKTAFSSKGPTIHHFPDVGKDIDYKRRRASMYKLLYSLDLEDGVEHTEPPVIVEDDA